MRNFEQASQVPDPKGDLPTQADVGYMLTQEEFNALIHACQSDLSPQGVRDRALFAATAVAGFRIGDVRNIDLTGVKKDDGNNGPSYRVTTKTKGSKLRTVPIKGGAALCLRDWLIIRGDTPGALFVPINKGQNLTHLENPDGGITCPPLSRSGLRKILLTRLNEAGIKIKPDDKQRGRAWHDFRRTLVSNLLTRMDLSATRKYIGHANVNTTAGYDIRPDDEIERMAGERFVPYGQMVLANIKPKKGDADGE